ncbi:MAG: hypothetical protein D4R64_16240 [Porphyromonadaceae bacterium]|nr:MAG: hypothetical protein D4R64_16240 [Porphyromonadaceae bacterium]
MQTKVDQLPVVVHNVIPQMDTITGLMILGYMVFTFLYVAEKQLTLIMWDVKKPLILNRTYILIRADCSVFISEDFQDAGFCI